MERARFINLVRQALRDVPPPFKDQLRQIDIVVKRRPGPADLRDADLAPDESMYGFYRGVPLTERDGGYQMVAPDIIDIYQEPLEEDSPLLGMDNVILTSHSVAWTVELFRDMGRMDCEGALAVQRGETPLHVVNRDVLARLCRRGR